MVHTDALWNLWSTTFRGTPLPLDPLVRWNIRVLSFDSNVWLFLRVSLLKNRVSKYRYKCKNTDVLEYECENEVNKWRKHQISKFYFKTVSLNSLYVSSFNFKGSLCLLHGIVIQAPVDTLWNYLPLGTCSLRNCT